MVSPEPRACEGFPMADDAPFSSGRSTTESLKTLAPRAISSPDSTSQSIVFS
jgi:hypothetical protein